MILIISEEDVKWFKETMENTLSTRVVTKDYLALSNIYHGMSFVFQMSGQSTLEEWATEQSKKYRELAYVRNKS